MADGMDAHAPDAVAMAGLRFGWPRQQGLCLDIPAFSLRRSERVFLHGPSGSGKSTLLGLIGGVLLPGDGELRVLGTSLAGLSPGARDAFRAEHVGFIFQQFNLLAHLPVLDNVVLPCRFSALRRARAERDGGGLRAEALRLLARLDLGPDLARRPVHALSVGQQQRVAAARALIGRPGLVVADEPTSALDSARQQDFLALLMQECAAAGAALLFVSHDARLAASFGRSVALPDINRAVA